MSANKIDNTNMERIDLNNSDVPYGMLFGGAHIEMFGNNKIVFEGRYTILEYTPELLKIKMYKRTLIVMGNQLTLSNVESGRFLLTGNVISIEFE
jgi:sporulation protein YqfC